MERIDGGFSMTKIDLVKLVRSANQELKEDTSLKATVDFVNEFVLLQSLPNAAQIALLSLRAELRSDPAKTESIRNFFGF